MTVASRSEWVVVPQNDINKPERIYKDGAGFQFMIAPSDMPVAFRVLLEPTGAPTTLIVEFKYLSAPEDTKVVEHKDGVKADVGKNSRKIYKLFLDLAALTKSASSINSKIDIAIPVLAHSIEAFGHEGRLRSGNADAVMRLMSFRNAFIHSAAAG